jgi:signal peptidase I
MKPYQSGPKTHFITILGFILLVTVWINLTPVQFGGRAVYLIIDGVSMEPFFYTGDLVILYQTDTYEMGDVAAYYEPFSGGIIIHRIIGQAGERFVFLGDNKPRIDIYKPKLSEMVGRYWFHIPAVGKVVSQFRVQNDSLLSQALVIGLGLFMIIPLAGNQKQPRRDRKAKKEQAPMAQVNKKDFALFLITLALASSAFAYFAFSLPLFHPVSDNISYEQQGTFNYSASAPPGIYNSDVAQTGDPIFRSLISQVTINFDYEFSSELPSSVTGTYRIRAEISHSNGWNSTLELSPETPFSDKHFSTSTIINLSQVQVVLDNLEQQTGLQSQQYRLDIVPVISINGALDGQPLQDEFSPRLAFDLDRVQMKLADTGSASYDTPPIDPLKPLQTGQLRIEHQAPNTLSIFKFALDVSLVRYIAVGGIVLSLSGLLILGWLAFQANQGDEAAQIAFKYSALLLPIQDGGVTPATDVVEMAAIDHLVHLAGRDGRMILHYVQGASHHYLVKDGATTYHYQVNNHPIKAKSQFSKTVLP